MYQEIDVQICYLTRIVTNLDEMKKNRNLYAKDFFKYKEDFLLTLKNSKSNSDFNMDGTFVITLNGKEIIPFEWWDDIPSLLAYFLNALEECLISKKAEFYYPDQPLLVQIELDEKDIILILEGFEYRLDKKIFLCAFLSKAKAFFEIIMNELNYLSYEYELTQIKKIYEGYNLYN